MQVADDAETREVRLDLWMLHCAELNIPGGAEADVVQRIELACSQTSVLRDTQLTVRWNTAVHQTNTNLVTPPPGTPGGRRSPSRGAHSQQQREKQQQQGTVRAALYGANSEERDAFFDRIEAHYNHRRVVPAPADRPVWNFADGDLVFDTRKMGQTLIEALSQTPRVAFPVISYLRALWLWRERRMRGLIRLRLVPSPRCTRTPYSSLGTSQLHRLVVLSGTVVRIGTSVSVCTSMVFQCTACGAKRTVSVDGALDFPVSCAGDKCRGRTFVPVTNDPEVRCDSVQYAKLQEEPDVGGGGGDARGGGADAAAGGDGGRRGAGGVGASSSLNKRKAAVPVTGPMDIFLQTGSLAGAAGMQGGGASADALGGAGNSMARQIVEICMTGALRDTVSPGDNIAVCGVLSARKLASANKSQRAASHMSCHVLGLRVVKASTTSVSVTGGSDKSSPATPAAGTGASAGDPLVLTGAGAISSPMFGSSALGPPRCDLLPVLVHRFCPTIFGHVRTKAALLLALVGGTHKPWPEAPRSQIHVLLLGDAGIGKSQLLRAAWQASRRGVYVTANASSACGLTVSLSRTAGSDATVCEAGAVMHGDGGVTCIDEIDKGGAEQKALLEVMEQQTVSIAKAGFVFSMPVRTSVISAGNPVDGRFDVAKTYAANVGLAPALVSRFDFVMLLADSDDFAAGGAGGAAAAAQHRGGPLADLYRVENNDFEPGTARVVIGNSPSQSSNSPGGSHDGDHAMDPRATSVGGTAPRSVAEHVLHAHRADLLGGRRAKNRQQQQQQQQQRQQQQQNSSSSDSFGDSQGGGGPTLHIPDIKTAIEMSRPRAPLLSLEAQDVLREAYLSARRRYFDIGTVDSAEVTPRYLQSLIRATEARAKLAMTDYASAAHARFAVELLESARSFHNSVRAPGTGTGIGVTGPLAAAAAAGAAGAPRAKRAGNQQERVIDAIRRYTATEGMQNGVRMISRSKAEEICEEIGVRNPEKMFDTLNDCGKLLMRSTAMFEFKG